MISCTNRFFFSRRTWSFKSSRVARCLKIVKLVSQELNHALGFCNIEGKFAFTNEVKKVEREAERKKVIAPVTSSHD